MWSWRLEAPGLKLLAREALLEGPADHQLVGKVTAYQGYDD